MKVFVAEAGVYAERYIEGVYATAEAAMAANPVSDETAADERMMRPQSKPGWREVREGEWDNGLDMGGAVSVTEFEVAS